MRRGLDIVIPLTVESYNAYLETASSGAASDLTRFKLPLPTPAISNANTSLESHLLVLVGNSKALWPPFLEFVRGELAQAPDGRVQRDPIDRFVQQSVSECLSELSSAYKDDEESEERLPAPVKVYWVADTEPGKMILAQKMALAAKRVSHCPVRTCGACSVYSRFM